MKRLVWALVLLIAVYGVTGVAPAQADGIEVRTSSASNVFPAGIEFQVFAASNVDITAVRLRYRILPDGVTTFVRPECTLGSQTNCRVTVGRANDTYIVPGAQIIYSWEVEDSAGGRFTSPEQSITYDDKRFDWQNINNNEVYLYFYTGTESSNAYLLEGAVDVINEYSELMRTTVTYPLKIWVYANRNDIDAAFPEDTDQGTIGQQVASDTAIFARSNNLLSILRHEVVHIVTDHATKGFPSGIPIWVNEGVSVTSETARVDYDAALTQAIRTDRVAPIASLNFAFRDSGQTTLFYAQSGSLVSYLIDEYGESKFGDFIAAFRNTNLEGALQRVYGIGVLQFENDWRESVGLEPITASATTNSNERAIPTIQPLGSNPGAPVATATRTAANEQQAEEETDDSSGGSSIALIAGVVVVVLALAGGGFFLMRRRGSGSTPPAA